MKNDEIINIETRKQQTAEIIKIYQSWYDFSRLHDYPAMLDLCIENSRFAELTNACARSMNLGIFYHYEFNDITIIHINSNSAIVAGDIKLIQSGQMLVFSGKFQSSCKYQMDDWDLDEIEVEWEL